MLNGQHLKESGTITNVLSSNVQQHSIDLNLIQINCLDEDEIGIINMHKTIVPKNIKIELNKDKQWCLYPGFYELKFDQGCYVTNNEMLLIRHRSSLLRNGCIITSGIFDSGFNTLNIGAYMLCTREIKISYMARVATIMSYECDKIDNLYDGQFQNDKQRI